MFISGYYNIDIKLFITSMFGFEEALLFQSFINMLSLVLFV